MFFTKNIINNYLNIEHIEHEEWDSKSNDINIEKGSKHILNGGLTCVLFAWKRKAPNEDYTTGNSVTKVYLHKYKCLTIK